MYARFSHVMGKPWLAQIKIHNEHPNNSLGTSEKKTSFCHTHTHRRFVIGRYKKKI